MRENELNTIIKNNFNWAWKFPDPSKSNIMGVDKQGKTIFSMRPNPFDGVGLTENFVVFFETKLLKDYRAFSFSKIADHQLHNLKMIHSATDKHLGTVVYPLIICGVYIPYKGIDLFFFHYLEIFNRIKAGDKSVKKKELLELKDKGSYLPVKKKTFQVNKIPEVIINGEKV